MSYTFVEIEERKSRHVALLFAFLAALYAGSLIALALGVNVLAGFSLHLRIVEEPFRPPILPGLLTTLVIAVVLSGAHWVYATHRLLDRVLDAVRARPLDAQDTYHAKLANIVEEVSVATGGRYRIEPRVIPTTAMNACAVSDFSGRAAIAVTEGLLSRLSRAQLEAVVGHEAAHIASGDSLSKSVFCGLFALHEEGLKRLSGLFEGERTSRTIGGRLGLIVLFVTVVLWVTNTVKRFCELLISREQEYRADAVAVKLTRNPLALAEALRVISRRWRGVGAEGESLSTIFILDPGEELLSEEEGLMADLFSTHPPTSRRIELLLGMAHVRPDDFEQTMAQRPKRPRMLIGERPKEQAAPDRWFIHLNDEWTGPLTLDAVAALPALKPDSWLRREGDAAAKPAYQEPSALRVLQRRYGSDGGVYECPNCRVSLSRISYEGVPLDECPACRGCYVKPDQISRVFVREDYAFPESIRRLAQAIPAVKSRHRIAYRFDKYPWKTLQGRRCPACGGAVVRKFYTVAYFVEVEQCYSCGLTWLDKDELELLQYLYESQESNQG